MYLEGAKDCALVCFFVWFCLGFVFPMSQSQQAQVSDHPQLSSFQFIIPSVFFFSSAISGSFVALVACFVYWTLLSGFCQVYSLNFYVSVPLFLLGHIKWEDVLCWKNLTIFFLCDCKMTKAKSLISLTKS